MTSGLTVPEERAERELKRIADTGGHQTFTAIVEWLRANRESVKTDVLQMRDDHGKKLEEIKSQVTKINGNVRDAHSEINKMKAKDQAEKAVEVARREWDSELKAQDDRKTVAHRWKLDLYAGGFVVVAVAVVEIILHAIGV